MNGHANIDTVEATEHLKTILNVGKNESESGKLKSISNGSDMGATEEDDSYQKITLCANKDSSHTAIHGTDVDIYSSPLEFGATCSQIIVEDMVDYGWEEKYYHGKLISIHLSGLYIAYVLKPVFNKPGFVRIWRTKLDLRYLIKEFKSEVKDLAFAHTTAQVLLGTVDACGELLVYKITDNGTVIICDLLLHIIRPEDWTPSEHNRIIWCLYIPDDMENEDEEEDSDAVMALVITHNERAEIWNVDTVIKEHDSGELTLDEVKVGVQVISDHRTPISAATFSPDGTALAIGSTEGVVKFFQVNILEKDVSPRCLHQWIPHPDKSLCSLYFLDNHKNHRPDVQFWKIAVTGADNNTEIKVWSCESWTCLQTIRIHPNLDDSVLPCLKAEIDLSSKYLFLSDIKRKVLLILNLQQDPVPSNVVVSSVSEYRVPLPVLSFAISSISHAKKHSIGGGKNSDDEGDNDEMGDDMNDSDDSAQKYMIKLFWIQTKSLQYCRIVYNPKLSPLKSVGSISSLSHDSFDCSTLFKDGLSDLSMEGHDVSAHSVKDLDMSSLTKALCSGDEHSSPPSIPPLPPSHMPSYPKCTEVLLTPGDFTCSSPAASSFTEVVSSKRESGGIESLPVETDSHLQQRRKSSQHSATSSPSREVAEILAPTSSKTLHLDEMVPETSVDIVKEEPIEDDLNSFVTESSGTPRNQPDYLKEWPQAPVPSAEFRVAARKENSEHPNRSQLFCSDGGKPVNDSLAMNSKLSELNHNFIELMRKLDTFTKAFQEQRCDIQALQSEVKLLRQDQKLSQTNLNNKLEHVTSLNHSRLENLILKKAEDERRKSDQNFTVLSEEISETFGSKLENTLKREIASTVIPQINRVLDAVAQKMQLDLNQKLSSTDSILRDNFMKHIKGKGFQDGLTQALSVSLQSSVQIACKDVFQSNVVPSFDKSCQQLFQQINDQFSRGIHEYIQFIEKHGQKSSVALESTVTAFKDEINRCTSGINEAIQKLVLQAENQNLDTAKHQEKLLSEIRHIVQLEVKKALREQTNAVLNSRSTTPVPSDPQIQKQHLMQLVKQGNVNEAFQQALSAIDVQLVMFLCESVNPDLVFGPTPCPLQQHVLLSLLHQLSSDLFSKTELKVRYIEDVMASLDRDDPIIKEHIHGVLNDLLQRISQFLQQNPSHRLSRNFKRISLAANSLIKR